MATDLPDITAFEAISTGLAPNDGLGDSPLEAALKLNRMLATLFAGNGTVAQIIEAVVAEQANLRELIEAGGLNAATLANTLTTAGIPVDHVQGLASAILSIVDDITTLQTTFAGLAARISALEA